MFSCVNHPQQSLMSAAVTAKPDPSTVAMVVTCRHTHEIEGANQNDRGGSELHVMQLRTMKELSRTRL
eukprot:4866853-Amphidinium_carterae.3